MEHLLGYWLGCYPKPGIISQPDTLIILGKDLVALRPVAVAPVLVDFSSATYRRGMMVLLLNIPGHLADIIVMMYFLRRNLHGRVSSHDEL